MNITKNLILIRSNDLIGKRMEFSNLGTSTNKNAQQKLFYKTLTELYD